MIILETRVKIYAMMLYHMYNYYTMYIISASADTRI